MRRSAAASPSPVLSISETVSDTPQFLTAKVADCGGPRARAFAYGRDRNRKLVDVAGNPRRTAPRLTEKLARSSSNGKHPNPSADSTSGNGGEKEYLAAAGLQPYLGIHQILQPPQQPSPPPLSSSPPAGRGMVDKMNRSSFRRMVGRTARRSVGPTGAGRASPSSAAFFATATGARATEPRQTGHEELELTQGPLKGNLPFFRSHSMAMARARAGSSAAGLTWHGQLRADKARASVEWTLA